MNPLVTYGGLKAGEGLLGWLGGKGDRDDEEERYQQAWNMLMGSTQGEPFDPNAVLANSKRAIASDVSDVGNQIDRTLDLDSGQGQGALWENILGRQYGTAANLFMNRDSEKWRRNYDVASQLLGISGSRLGGV